MQRFEFVTPIPPIVTGTAFYFDLLLKNLLASGVDPERMVIVSDAEGWESASKGKPFPTHFQNVAVTDWEAVAPSPAANTVRLYFLANNDKHVFAHRRLAQQSPDAAGYVISVLHDPSMFMVHEHMMRRSVPEFGVDACAGIMASQLGSGSGNHLRAFMNGWLPDSFSYGVHCMGNALAHSDEIWTHSVYGANRVLYENRFESARCKAIKVCAHPVEQAEPAPVVQQKAPETDRFNIGVFGWVTPPKRVTSVLRGLALAVNRMDASELQRVRLRIVGQRSAEYGREVTDLVKALNLEAYVEFHDFPPKDEFERLIQDSNLIFNLRFPSCGETSGTLVSAQTHNIKVVTSRFQSFREADGIWRYINVAEPYETWDIAEAVIDAMRSPDSVPDQTSACATSAVSPIENLIARMMNVAAQEKL